MYGSMEGACMGPLQGLTQQYIYIYNRGRVEVYPLGMEELRWGGGGEEDGWSAAEGGHDMIIMYVPQRHDIQCDNFLDRIDIHYYTIHTYTIPFFL